MHVCIKDTDNFLWVRGYEEKGVGRLEKVVCFLILVCIQEIIKQASILG